MDWQGGLATFRIQAEFAQQIIINHYSFYLHLYTMYFEGVSSMNLIQIHLRLKFLNIVQFRWPWQLP